MTKLAAVLGLGLTVLLLAALAVHAMSASSLTYRLVETTPAAKGLAQSASYRAYTSTGQPAPVGISASATYQHFSGFVYTLTVAGNRPPQLSPIGSKRVHEESLLSFKLGAIDPDGDALTFDATPLPAGASLVGRTFAWTPAVGQAGSYNVTFSVSDSSLSDSEVVAIRIDPLGAPVADAGNDRGAIAASNFDLWGCRSSDPDGDPLTYSWAQVDSTGYVATPYGDFTPCNPHYAAPAGAPVGTILTFELTVSDGTQSDTDTVNVTIMSCFIATAAYGSALAPELEILRAYRDEVLLTNPWGKQLVRLYYRTSPPLGRFIAEKSWRRACARDMLRPVVMGARWWLTRQGLYADTTKESR